jgi:hypothetical protein
VTRPPVVAALPRQAPLRCRGVPSPRESRGFERRPSPTASRRIRGNRCSQCPPGWRNRQTRWSQTPLAARPCGFDSRSGHAISSAFLLVTGSGCPGIGHEAPAVITVWSQSPSTIAAPAAPGLEHQVCQARAAGWTWAQIATECVGPAILGRLTQMDAERNARKPE